MRLLPLTASLVAFGSFGCGPHTTLEGPGTEPHQDESAETRPKRVKARPPAQRVLIGEMCPRVAAGRPGVMPVFVRGADWTIDQDDVVGPLARRSARQFSVHRWDGSRAGVFSVAGLAELGRERKAAVGSYAGASPCVPRMKGGTEGAPDPACVAAQSNCGIAVSVLEAGGGLNARPFEEDPDPISLPIGGACVADGKLLVDIDRDGSAEAFPVDGFLNPVRAPSEEVVAVPRRQSKCSPRFAQRHVIPPGDPRHWRGMDLLGVLDIDGDGRFEIIVVYHYSDRRTWAIYSSTSTAGRLDLVGEAMPWPRP